MTQATATTIAAIAGVAAVCVAAWYAYLTHRLAGVAQRQMLHLQRTEASARQAEATVLEFLARRLRTTLEQLPRNKSVDGGARKIRAAVLWDREDLRDLERLAARLGPWASGPLVNVVRHLTWIARKTEESRTPSALLGYDWEAFPWGDWEKAWDESAKHLDVVARLANNEVDEQGKILRA